ncbi:MAG: hypothetical protein NT120_03165 [Candidatus Aenigmarchaeota archaeon]|nr:hypothetical protein [Candidatus Aenigmarchaeota archaeon]
MKDSTKKWTAVALVGGWLAVCAAVEINSYFEKIRRGEKKAEHSAYVRDVGKYVKDVHRGESYKADSLISIMNNREFIEYFDDAIDALGRAGGRRAYAKLMALVDNSSIYSLKGQDAERIAKALNRIAGARTVKYIVKRLTDKPKPDGFNTQRLMDVLTYMIFNNAPYHDEENQIFDIFSRKVLGGFKRCYEVKYASVLRMIDPKKAELVDDELGNGLWGVYDNNECLKEIKLVLQGKSLH